MISTHLVYVVISVAVLSIALPRVHADVISVTCGSSVRTISECSAGELDAPPPCWRCDRLTPGSFPRDPAAARLATFNLAGPEWEQLDTCPDLALRLDLLATEIAASGAWVVGLNEVDNETLRTGGGASTAGFDVVEQLESRLEVLTGVSWHGAFAATLPSYKCGSYGNAILSTAPISVAAVLTEPAGPGGDGQTRGALLATTHGLQVVSTHWPRYDTAQYEGLNAQLHTALTPHAPTVILGDFNRASGNDPNTLPMETFFPPEEGFAVVTDALTSTRVAVVSTWDHVVTRNVVIPRASVATRCPSTGAACPSPSGDALWPDYFSDHLLVHANLPFQWSAITVVAVPGQPDALLRYARSINLVLAGRGWGRLEQPDGGVHWARQDWRPTWDIQMSGDFDGDGARDDVIAYDPNAGVGACYATWSGGVAAWAVLNESDRWRRTWDAIVPIDVPGGAHTDLLFYDAEQRTAQLQRVSGQGVLSELGAWSSWRATWQYLLAGDFDGDGVENDLLLYDRGDFTFLRFNATGGYSALRNGTGWSPDWDAIVPLDLEGSVQTDLVLYDGDTRTMAVYRVGAGASMTLLQTRTNWRATWTMLRAGDFDGDGRANEVVLYDAGADEQIVLRFYSDGTYTYL